MNFTFVRFIIVGVLNTFVGLSVIYLLLNGAGFSYWSSTFLGNFVGASVSFFLNRSFTFRNDQSLWKSMIRFIGVILFCYFISYSTGKYLVEWLLHKRIFLSSNMTTDLQVLGSACLYTVLNYLLQKWYVFPLGTSQKLRENLGK